MKLQNDKNANNNYEYLLKNNKIMVQAYISRQF